VTVHIGPPEDVAVASPTQVVGRRCAQFAVDRLLVLVPAMIVLIGGFFAVLHAVRAGGPLSLAYLPPGAFLLITAGGTWLTDVWLPHRSHGASPGMRWLGLRVVTEQGTEPALRDYTVRWLLYVVDGVLFGLVALIVILASRRHQRVGDLVARTLVVRA
jgi:uncharacterized RDD family membrane protein YckC